jgi:hypothetical protein
VNRLLCPTIDWQDAFDTYKNDVDALIAAFYDRRTPAGAGCTKDQGLPGILRLRGDQGFPRRPTKRGKPRRRMQWLLNLLNLLILLKVTERPANEPPSPILRPQGAFPGKVAPPAPPPQITEKPKAAQTSLFGWETLDERPRTGKSGAKALAGMAAGKGEGAPGGGQIQRGGARRGGVGAGGNRAPHALPGLFDFGGEGGALSLFILLPPEEDQEDDEQAAELRELDRAYRKSPPPESQM